MEQKLEMKKQSLSTASMLTAIGASLMYGVTVVIGMLDQKTLATGVIWLLGLILFLVGLYNTSSAFRGIKDTVAALFKVLFNASLFMVIALVAFMIILFVFTGPMTGLMTDSIIYSNVSTNITIVKILTIVVIAGVVYFINQCRVASMKLSKAGLPSMKHCGIAYTIQMIVYGILGLCIFILLFKTRSAFFSMGGYGYGHHVAYNVLAILLIGLTLITACVFMIIGWWSVRSEMQQLLDTPDQEQNI